MFANSVFGQNLAAPVSTGVARQATEKKPYESLVDKAQATLINALTMNKDMDFNNARLYYLYADAILEKLEGSEVEFGKIVNKILRKNLSIIAPSVNTEMDKDSDQSDESSDQDQSEVNLDTIKAAAKNSLQVEEDEEEEEEADSKKLEKIAVMAEDQRLVNEVPKKVYRDDLQIAWEALEASRIITEAHIAKLDTSANPEEYKKCRKALGVVRMRLGDTMALKGENDKALAEYQESINLLKEYEEANQRELAAAYYSIAALELAEGGKSPKTKYLQRARRMIEKLICDITGNPYEELKDNEVKMEWTVVQAGTDVPHLKNLKNVLAIMYDRINEVYNPKEEKDASESEKEEVSKKEPKGSVESEKEPSGPENEQSVQSGQDRSESESEEEVVIKKKRARKVPKAKPLKKKFKK